MNSEDLRWSASQLSVILNRLSFKSNCEKRRGLSQFSDELGASGGTLSYFTVAAWLVGHGILSKIVTDHVRPDFDGIPVLSRVDFANGAYHVWHDDTVAQVSLNGLRLLSIWSVLDGKLQFLDESVVLWLDSVTEASSLS